MFECELTEKKFWELYAKLTVLLQQAQDQKGNIDSEKIETAIAWNPNEENSSNSIRVYRLCGACVEQIRIIGTEKQKKEDSDIIII